jgi:hypothetical protein
MGHGWQSVPFLFDKRFVKTIHTHTPEKISNIFVANSTFYLQELSSFCQMFVSLGEGVITFLSTKLLF